MTPAELDRWTTSAQIIAEAQAHGWTVTEVIELLQDHVREDGCDLDQCLDLIRASDFLGPRPGEVSDGLVVGEMSTLVRLARDAWVYWFHHGYGGEDVLIRDAIARHEAEASVVGVDPIHLMRCIQGAGWYFQARHAGIRQYGYAVTYPGDPTVAGLPDPVRGSASDCEGGAR